MPESLGNDMYLYLFRGDLVGEFGRINCTVCIEGKAYVRVVSYSKSFQQCIHQMIAIWYIELTTSLKHLNMRLHFKDLVPRQ
jgi:hypothetical protein